MRANKMRIRHACQWTKACRPFVRGASSTSSLSTPGRNVQAIPSLRAELVALLKDKCDGIHPVVVETSNRADADYALTSAMEMFRSRKGSYATPKDAAAAIINRCLGKSNKFSFSQANFYVNAKVSDDFLSERMTNILKGEVPAPPAIDRTLRVVIDFSSPNIAKQMHVGHLRSTVIGNCLAGLHEFVGHETVRVNHLGDWGTQFGTLLTHMMDTWGADQVLAKVQVSSVSELTRLYQDSKKRLDADQDFAARARQTTVELQSQQNEKLTALWKALVTISIKDFDAIYDRLGIPRNKWQYLGESFYQNKIMDAISELKQYVTESPTDQSILLFTDLPEAKFKRGDNTIDEVPLIIRKSDGGVGYDATDVAAIRYRLKIWQAEKLLYVTDAGQALHFALVFQAAKLAGWAQLSAGSEASLNHVPFGVVRKAAGGRIKTREGGAETLDSLLDKANERMFKILQSKRKDGWTVQELQVLQTLGDTLGIACVVFAELKTNRTMDYEFNVDRMCNPDGDSAIYIIHVLEKIRRHMRASQVVVDCSYDLVSASAKERALALNVAKFQDVVETSLASLTPHILCLHALSLAADVSSFLEDRKEQGDAGRERQRLLLVHAAGKIIQQHLALIGLGPLLAKMQPSLEAIRTWSHVEVL